MMKRTTAAALVLTMFLTLLAFAPAVCSAADASAKLKVRVDIFDAKMFWSYPYITKDGKVRKPHVVQVVWTTNSGTKANRADIAVTGSERGDLTITTDKNEFLDLEIVVLDDKNISLAKGGLQLRNTGQEVSFLVSPPESTAPVIEMQ